MTTTTTEVVPLAERQWLRPLEVVVLYPLGQAQLAQWRQKGIGPAYFRRGRTVIYRRADIDAWLEANLTGGSAD